MPPGAVGYLGAWLAVWLNGLFCVCLLGFSCACRRLLVLFASVWPQGYMFVPVWLLECARPPPAPCDVQGVELAECALEEAAALSWYCSPGFAAAVAALGPRLRARDVYHALTRAPRRRMLLKMLAVAAWFPVSPAGARARARVAPPATVDPVPVPWRGSGWGEDVGAGAGVGLGAAAAAAGAGTVVG
jgi:hypothetical protein